MFNRKKKEVIIENQVIKCNFCERESKANYGKLFYCGDNKCAKKFWKKKTKITRTKNAEKEKTSNDFTN